MKDKLLKTLGPSYVIIWVTFSIIFPTHSHSQDLSNNFVLKFTSSRLLSLILITFGIVSIILNVRSQIQSGDVGKMQSFSIAFILSLITIILSAILIVFSSGFGTGGGKAGAILSLTLGMVGLGLSCWKYTKKHKNRKSNNF